jgi:plasmid replication initiation protein|tara:strand:+ start:95 stop:1015 length:921 start_codon:yes stop_codon:yes gene_type:complete
MKGTELTEIRQHNVITSARYEMSACEMDIIFCLLSKLNPHQNSNTYKISAQEIENLSGRKWNYQRLKEATEKLGSRVYEIDTKERYTQIWMLSAADYMKGTGVLQLELTERIKPYLLDLREKFTSYKLQSALSLTSKYAKRIYQLACQWKSVGKVHYSIDEFKYMLYLKDPKGKKSEQYKQIGELKKKVLDIAKEQINSHTDLIIDYQLHKESRSFRSITFYIQTQKIKLEPVDFSHDSKRKRVLEVAKELGIIRDDLLQKISENEEIQKMLRKYTNDIKLGNYKEVKNKAAYFIKMMENHRHTER